jgi:hypothetical protein
MTKLSGSTSPALEKVDSPPPELPLFRFGLRHLFWFVTVVSVLFAIAVAISPGVAPLVLLIAATIVAAHVTGTSLATRLRAHADQVRDWEDAHRLENNDGPDASERACHLSTLPLPPTSPWHHRGGASLAQLPMLIVAGAIVGGCVGAAFLAVTVGHRTSAIGIAVGSVSLAVVGGWLAFVAGNFYAIFRDGLRDAMAQQKMDSTCADTRRLP